MKGAEKVGLALFLISLGTAGIVGWAIGDVQSKLERTKLEESYQKQLDEQKARYEAKLPYTALQGRNVEGNNVYIVQSKDGTRYGMIEVNGRYYTMPALKETTATRSRSGVTPKSTSDLAQKVEEEVGHAAQKKE